jgi:hypothetical protein
MNQPTKMVLLIWLACLFEAVGLFAQNQQSPEKPGVSIMVRDDYASSAIIFSGKWQVSNGKNEDDGSVVWIRCDVNEKECIAVYGTLLMANRVQLQGTLYKIKSWDGGKIVAEGYSPDGCTRSMLVASVKEKNVEQMNSPVTPYPKHCAQSDSLLENSYSRKALQKAQAEQARLVPTEWWGIGDAPPRKPENH